MVNGQELEFDRAWESGVGVEWHPSVFYGLFGGYMFYDHCVNVRLLSIERAVEQTLQERSRVSGEDGRWKCVCVGGGGDSHIWLRILMFIWFFALRKEP
jgi:hypothetical protein